MISIFNTSKSSWLPASIFSITNLCAMLFAITLFSACQKEEKASPLTLLRIDSSVDSVLRKGSETVLEEYYTPHSSVSPDLSWESSDPSVLTITGTGTALGVKVGKAVLTLKVNDGTGLQYSKTIYVYDNPVINSVTDITYFSAKFLVNFNTGGNTADRRGFCFDTKADFDTTNCTAVFYCKATDTIPLVNYFEAEKQYYVKAFIVNAHGLIYSPNVSVNTTATPAGLEGNYPLNIALATGQVAKSGDWIYFTNQNDYYLYRIKNDLTGKQKFSTIQYVNYINISGGYTYFGTNSGINQTYLDGNKSKYLNFSLSVNGSTPQTRFQIFGSYIYCFGLSSGFYRIRTDGTGRENIQDGINGNVNIYNNKIYAVGYTKNTSDYSCSIYVCNMDGSEKQVLQTVSINKDSTINVYLSVYGGSAFFFDNKYFRKLDLQNPAIIQTLPFTPWYSNYNIANDAIFYSNPSDANKLYKTDLAGLVHKKLSDDCVYRISIIDDWLYYIVSLGNYKYSLYRIKQDGTNRQLVD